MLFLFCHHLIRYVLFVLHHLIRYVIFVLSPSNKICLFVLSPSNKICLFVLSPSNKICFFSSESRAQEEHEIYSQRIKERLSGSTASPGPFASSPNPLDISGLLTPDMLKQKMMSAVQHVDHSWKLRPDMAYSEQLRSEFYYEQVRISFDTYKVTPNLL